MAKRITLTSMRPDQIVECASVNCRSGIACWWVESGDVGSPYCGDCAMSILQLSVKGQQPPTPAPPVSA